VIKTIMIPISFEDLGHLTAVSVSQIAMKQSDRRMRGWGLRSVRLAARRRPCSGLRWVSRPRQWPRAAPRYARPKGGSCRLAIGRATLGLERRPDCSAEAKERPETKSPAQGTTRGQARAFGFEFGARNRLKRR